MTQHNMGKIIGDGADAQQPFRPGPRRSRNGIEYVALGLLGVAVLTAGIVPRLRQHEALAQGIADQKRDIGTPTVEVASLPLASPPAAAGEKTGKPLGGLTLPASIQAIEETAINARATGYLRRRYVDIGTRVRAGQLLAEIESPDVDQQLSQAQADWAKSQAGTGQASADAARLEAGVAQSSADVERSRAGVDQARSANKKAQAALVHAHNAVASSEARLAASEQAREGRKADLAQLHTQLLLDEKEARRWQELGKQGAVAQEQVDAKETAYQARLSSITAAEAAVRSADADVAAAKQAVAAAESDVEAARADVVTSEQQVRAARAQVASSGATVRAAQAGATAGHANIRAAVAQAQSSDANVRRFAVLRSFERVTAPFAGIVTARNVDTGALITGAGTAPLFTLARTDVLRIMVNVPQSRVRSIHAGQHVDVLVREFGDRTFTGTVSSTSGALDPQTRTLLTEIHVPNTNGVLLPGMYAQVRFPGDAPAAGGGEAAGGMPRIPAEALISDAQGTRVASVTPDNRVRFLQVTVSRDFGTTLEVSQGLSGSERLILNPGDDLKENETVRIAPPLAEKPGPR